MRLERVVRLKWRDVSVIELDWSTGEGSVGIATLTVQAFAWSKRSHDFVRLVVCNKMRVDVRFFARVRCADRIGSGFGSLKRFRYSECDVLAVVTNHIVFKWRPSLFAHTGESRPGNRPKNLADILAMKNGMHARHLLSRCRIEFCDLSVGDGRADRNGIKHSREVKVSGVLRRSRDLAWSIHSNCIAADD